MNKPVSTIFVLLATIIITCTAQNEPKCNGVYSDGFLNIIAVDVCINNTVFYPVVLSERYECENNQVYHSYFGSHTECNGSPDQRTKVNDNIICDGQINCPYSIVRTYGYNNSCNDMGIWWDIPYIVNVCQSVNNPSDNTASGILECDPNIGITRKLYTKENCEGDIVEEIVTIAANQCVINNTPLNVKLIACNQRNDVYTSNTIETAAAAQQNIKNGDIMEVYGIAEFVGDVKGEIVIDENGNIEIDLDVFLLDDVLCDNKEYLYGIYNEWKYNDKEEKYGDDCNMDMIGDYMDPFETGITCNELGNEQEIDFFNCAIGDLSGRFGVIKPDKNGKISTENNISYSSNSGRNDGFCGLRLNPQSVYRKSVVFWCNNNAKTLLFCAPFTIKVYDDGRE